MTNHVGKIFRLVDPYTVGEMSDHVEIHVSPDVVLDRDLDSYNIYCRKGFRCASGPKPIPNKIDYFSLENTLLQFGKGPTRGWTEAQAVAERVPLAQAKEIALAFGQENGVVVYQAGDAAGNTVLWHPDGWEPHFEQSPAAFDIKNVLSQFNNYNKKNTA